MFLHTDIPLKTGGMYGGFQDKLNRNFRAKNLPGAIARKFPG
jgi:hypothetical protein